MIPFMPFPSPFLQSPTREYRIRPTFPGPYMLLSPFDNSASVLGNMLRRFMVSWVKLLRNVLYIQTISAFIFPFALTYISFMWQFSVTFAVAAPNGRTETSSWASCYLLFMWCPHSILPEYKLGGNPMTR